MSSAESIASTATRARRISDAPGRKTSVVARRALDRGGPHSRSDAGLERPGVAVRRVPDLDREGAAGDTQDRRRAALVGEERGHRAGVERGGRDEDEQVLAERRADLAEHREGEVGVAASLVELVEHHAGDAGERRVLREAGA